MSGFDRFDRVACINLSTRDDRWKLFTDQIPGDWDLGEIERYEAIAGALCQRPDWWAAGGGAWGCYRSHVRILEECLNRGLTSCLFLEDDARFCDGFVGKCREFLNNLPDDWGFVYMGGQHLHARKHPPTALGDGVFVPYNVNRTHAFAIRGTKNLVRVYKHLNDTKSWRSAQHIDHHLGRLHQRRDMPIYCPGEWLVAQAEGRSNISGRVNPEKIWNHAADVVRLPHPLTLVLGTHRCGSSCLAMMLHKLGVHLGNKFVGAEMRRGGSGEAHELMQIMEAALPCPSLVPQLDEVRVRNRLQRLIKRMTREAEERETVAGLKYPQLAHYAHVVESLCSGDLRVVDMRRPLEESIASLTKREPSLDAWAVRDHQRMLHDHREQFLAEFSGPRVRVEYDEVLTDPAAVVARLVEFLDLHPTNKQIEDAVAHPRPEHRSVGGTSS